MLERPVAETPSARDRLTALLIGLAALVVFNANLRTIAAGDTFPARYLPFGILRDRSLTLDRLMPLAGQGHGGRAYWIVRAPDGRAASLYPIVLPVLATPLYVPAYLHLRSAGWAPERFELVARVMEKVTASLIAAATTALVYLLLRRRVGPRTAIPLALVFAFGTTTWVISSQALWQHGLGQLLAAGALLLVTGRVTTARAIALGALCGLLAGNRPPDALLAAALGGPGLWWAGRRALLVAASAAVPAGLVLAYNLGVVGHVGGGYGLCGTPAFVSHPLPSGLAGLLFSPSKGLFVFSPFLLALPLGVRKLWGDRAARPLIAALAAGIGAQLVLYGKADWRAGASWGPRWLTDALPLLFWMLAPAVEPLRGAGRAVFAGACGLAIAIEAVGAFWYAGASDPAILAGPPSSAPGAWSVRNAPFVRELEHAAAAPDLLTSVHGSVDRISPAGRPGDDVAVGEPIVAEGWSLAGGRTPDAVGLLLDGAPAGSARRFFARQDVSAAAGTNAAAGWMVRLETDDLGAGEHVVAAYAVAGPFGESRYVSERRFRIVDTAGGEGDGLDGSARRAVEALRARQSPDGYWLTSFTNGSRWDRPAVEMNTFLTSVLLDLLAPAAGDAGLDAEVARARRHLTAQIERDGLVRYHGLPDAPTIGSLGCAITPDTDDTALVWRVAPGEDGASLRNALRIIASYRRPDGLYRTWLAPPGRTSCIDPGSDPNPADAAIQMHLYLLLRRADPPAARSLCEALGRRVDDEAIWVYYRRAPLVPLLRQADLAREGCVLRLPPAREVSEVPGQEPWVDAARRLALFVRGDERPDRGETLRLLRSIAEDDFALLRRSPPLLYHNDPTASVPRVYWSEDFGRALWLRLRHENDRTR